MYNDGEVTFCTDVVYDNPAQDAKAACSIGVEGSQHGTHRAIECRATVEAKPPKPDEDCTDEDKCWVVGAAVDLITLG